MVLRIEDEMAGKAIITDRQVQAAGVGRYGLGEGLMLDVKAAKSGGEPGKYWTMRYTAPATGKARWLGLGTYPKVSLAAARKARDAAQELLDRGIDPLEHRAAEKAAKRVAATQADSRTFDKVAKAFIEAKSAGWSNRKHIAQWTATLNTYASPIIGALDVAAITTEHILTVLTRQQPNDPDSKGIWNDKPETASRVRGRMESVLAFAIARGLAKAPNPATWRGHLSALLPSPRKVRAVQHHAALDFRQMGAFTAQLRQAPGIGARALEFGILCASRSAEIRLATWTEIDMQAGIWTIPAARMKAKRAHRVPLSDRALEVLREIGTGEPDTLVFESTLRAGRPLSDATLNAVIARMGYDVTQHGFRSAFRDWAAETTNYPNIVCEMALAHQVGNAVEAAYRRGDLLERRKALMADWAAYCAQAPETASVTPIRGDAESAA